MISANQMSRVRLGITLIATTTRTIDNKLSYNDVRRKEIIAFNYIHIKKSKRLLKY